MGRSRPFWVLMVLLAIAAMGAAPALSQENTSPDYHRLKAAFIFNFTKFAEWPADCFESEQSPIVIGIFGETPVGKFLEEGVRGKTVGKRSIQVMRFSSADGAERSHVLYVPETDDGSLRNLLAKLRGKPILTIGDNGRFTAEGGIIRLFEEEKKIRFEVNVKRAEGVGIRLSSQLLQLAKIYKE